jgi:hypothetical protein
MNRFTHGSVPSSAALRTPFAGAFAIARGLLLLLRPART